MISAREPIGLKGDIWTRVDKVYDMKNDMLLSVYHILQQRKQLICTRKISHFWIELRGRSIFIRLLGRCIYFYPLQNIHLPSNWIYRINLRPSQLLNQKKNLLSSQKFNLENIIFLNGKCFIYISQSIKLHMYIYKQAIKLHMYIYKQAIKLHMYIYKQAIKLHMYIYKQAIKLHMYIYKQAIKLHMYIYKQAIKLHMYIYKQAIKLHMYIYKQAIKLHMYIYKQAIKLHMYIYKQAIKLHMYIYKQAINIMY